LGVASTFAMSQVLIQVEYAKNEIAVIAGDMLSKKIHDEGRLDVADGILESLREFIPVDGVVIDVGAYIGDHTLSYSKFVGPRGLVYAIEPNPIAVGCLRHNMLKFNCANVVIMPIAFGGRKAKADLIYDSGDWSACRLTNDDEGFVDVATLDSQFQMLTKLNFLKIDAEGFEPMILSGARETLLRLRPNILIEINPYMLAKYGFEPDDVYRRLENLKYVSAGTYGTDGNYVNVLYRAA
jgi:FkbM family methyltransferase